MTPMERALKIHNQAQRRVAGQWVTYSDGEISIRCKAIRAQDNIAQIEGEGEIRVDGDQIDWLIIAADLKNDGSEIRPRVGARITPDSAEAVFEVIDGPAGKCWEWSGPDRYRIHTDEIQVV